ncbi:MAG: DUF3035 domain-containing protein [Proteobacteria bacterium]|nr:DUF3035 domain-containing protein [Pseudomonadota bacterium]
MTTTKTLTLLAMVAAAASASSGCAAFGRAVGASKVSPDEFRVVSQAPLTLPPDYSLRPPRPGEPRPQELQPTEEARQSLFGQDVGASASAGERRLVADAHADATDPNIRDTVDFESQSIVRRNESFVNRLLSFGSSPSTNAPLDAQAEQQRLAEEESIRRTTGGGQVIIQRDSGGFKLPGT